MELFIIYYPKEQILDSTNIRSHPKRPKKKYFRKIFLCQMSFLAWRPSSVVR
jgi:hypothetical protein